MALTDQNIRLMASEVLADVPEGGGRMSGVEVIDGVSNNLMPDVSDLDRTMGNVALRKAFPAVLADNTDTYYGVTVIVDKAPIDPNVSVTLFTTKSWTDHRADAVSRMESYLARGPKYDGFLWEQHIAGQKALAIIQRTDRELPPIGSTLVLVKDAGITTEKTQFERVLKTAASNRVFSASGCSAEFTRTVINADVSDPLLVDMLGGIPNCNDDAATSKADTTLYTTVVADAAQYAGITPLAEAVSLGSYSLKVDSIFGQLVPSAQIESAITDAKPNGDSIIPVAAGGAASLSTYATWDPTNNLFVGQGVFPGSLSVSVSRITVTDKAGKLMVGTDQIGTIDYSNGILSIVSGGPDYGGAQKNITFIPAAYPLRPIQTSAFPITPESRSGSIVFILDPIAAPGSLSISYMAQGVWYVLTDDGSGAIRGLDSSYGSGTINYATGSVVVTLGALPDVGSTVIASWGTKALDNNRSGITVKAETKYTLTKTAVAPGSFTATWPDGAGATLTATDDTLGNLTGDATGTINYATGEVVLRPNLLPAGGAEITNTYSWGDPTKDAFAHPARDVNGKLALTTSAVNILPGTVQIEWNTLTDTSVLGLYTAEQLEAMDVRLTDPTLYAKDDKAGNLVRNGAVIGTIDYATGAVLFNPDSSIAIPYPQYNRDPQYNRGHSLNGTLFRIILAGIAYTQAPTLYPNDTSGYVNITYRSGNAATAQTDTATFTPTMDLTPQYKETIVPGSVRLGLGAEALIDRQGRLYQDIDNANSSGTEVGTLDYTTGTATLSAWASGTTNAISIDALTTTLGNMVVDEVTFRTASAPLRPASLVFQGQFADSTELVTFNADSDGVITAPSVTGKIDYQTGIVSLNFGDWVTAAGNESEVWYDPSGVVGGQIFKPRPMLAATMRYAAVAYTYIPLDKEILGVDPVRLPTDGRVPIFRIGNIGVVHHTQETPVATITVPQTVNLGRTRLSRVWLFDEGNADTRVPTTQYTADLDAGTVTLTDATGLVGPIRIEDRIEDMALISDVQINGQLTFTRALTHDYPIGTQVSSALVVGNLQARVGAIFDQATWTGEWSDELIGSESLAEYNSIQYPILVTNEGAAQERWALIFNSTTEVRVIGESVGQIATLSIANEIAPLNPATNKPYFRINPAGWGSGWSAGNLLRINTIAANYPIWIARTVKQGPGITGGDGFRVQIRGNANAQ
ncbi:MAG: hypothetical protein JXK51_06660 [Halothiobacillaceae bacterium]|nr:hypothetical protein [Halothiobacillaceae bacterium]